MSEALKYIRAHQYLYYCTGFTVVSDYEYDMWGKYNCPEDYKGGSDSESSYSEEIKQLAKDILARKLAPFPF